MYDHNSVLIAGLLLLALAAAIEAGYHLGMRSRPMASDSSKTHINTIQASLLGVLALLLGFTFSISLQRFDKRSEAVIDEANAIGTAYLRTQLLPPALGEDARQQLRQYLDLRLASGAIALANPAARHALLDQAGRQQNRLWQQAVLAAEADSRPVTSGLYLQALNELIDAYGRRDAALNRHVPEVVLLLLFTTFLLTSTIVGYSAGLAGHRATFVTYVMISLIVVLVFIIVDLDRPRRGLIQVDQTSLMDLRETMSSSPLQSLAAPAGHAR